MKKLKKILIIKLTSMGDVIMSLPVAENIRQHDPDAVIGWVTEDKSLEAVQDYDGVDKLYVFKKRQIEAWAKKHAYIKIIKYVLSFAKEIKRDKWEVALDLQGVFRSSLLPYLARIPKRVAYTKGLHKVFLTKNVDKKGFPGGHAVEWYQFMAREAGLISGHGKITLFYPLSDDKKRFAAEITAKYRARGPVVGISPLTRWDTKNWPAEYYTRLIVLLAEKNVTALVFGGPAESAFADSVIGDSTNGVNLAGKLTVSELAAVISETDLFISGDSGPMHVAAAAGVPQIALFGPTDRHLTGPWSDKAFVMESGAECAPCFHKACPLQSDKKKCMFAITPEDVREKVMELI